MDALDDWEKPINVGTISSHEHQYSWERSPFSHIFMLQAYFHMCQMPTYSVPANLSRDNILKPHIVLGPRYYHMCWMCASPHICGATRSSPAKKDKIYGCSKRASQHICGPLGAVQPTGINIWVLQHAADIYVWLLWAVQPTGIKYMGTPSVPADIYVWQLWAVQLTSGLYLPPCYPVLQEHRLLLHFLFFVPVFMYIIWDEFKSAHEPLVPSITYYRHP